MQFNRPDYQGRIIDTAGKIKGPVMLLHAGDICASKVLNFYASVAHEMGASAEYVAKIKEQAAAMVAWQLTNPAKVPDLATQPDAAMPAGTATTGDAGSPPVKVRRGMMVDYYPNGNGGEFTGKEPRAALITEVAEDGTTVNMHIFHNNNFGMHFRANVPYTTGNNTTAYWAYPEA